MYDIRIAQTEDELEELYRFRYRIYIDEMNRPQQDADHRRRRIVDVLDATAFNLVAYRSGVMVGAVRVNFAGGGDIPYYSEFFRLAEQPGLTVDNASICTRMMVAREVRRSALSSQLCLAAFRFGVPRGIRWNFIDCNAHLVKFFEAFGYRHYMGTAIHKEYGEVHPLKLDCHDEGLFREIGSPFLGALVEWRERVGSEFQGIGQEAPGAVQA